MNVQMHTSLFPHNIISNVSEEDRKTTDLLLKSVSLFEKASGRLVYAVEYCQNEVIYISDRLRLFLGINESLEHVSIHDFYENYFGSSDILKLQDYREKSASIFHAFMQEEVPVYAFRCDINIHIGGEKKLYNLCAIPLQRTTDGKLLVMECILSPSSEKKSGNAIIYIIDTKTYYVFDEESKTWNEYVAATLNEREKKIVELSAQGYKEEYIAQMLCKSIHSIKATKQQLFEKLHVKNITEALMLCLNHNLL